MKLNKLLEKIENIKVEFYKEDKFKINFNGKIYDFWEEFYPKFAYDKTTKENSVIEGIQLYFNKYNKERLNLKPLIDLFSPKFEKPDIKLRGEFVNNKFIIDESSLEIDEEELKVSKVKNKLLDVENPYNDL